MIISIACIIWASMSKAVPQGKSKIEDEDADDEEDEEVEEVQEKKSKEKMIKCRFCKKKYGSDYNGCPYCKKV